MEVSEENRKTIVIVLWKTCGKCHKHIEINAFFQIEQKEN